MTEIYNASATWFHDAIAVEFERQERLENAVFDEFCNFEMWDSAVVEDEDEDADAESALQNFQGGYVLDMRIGAGMQLCASGGIA